ncbi:mediator complex, subunit Med8 [Neohortaea acidophila]|uniref:Mediator of RNA polymerase II transcription subunit 8 n=1 Tax=Neohortaea acidophila TaxID=245834 RepID=A0A6A6Q5J4_9PEZI|nr:mediator complex, subunit Med8 [Neohortaea acidophila]KAF2486687.1 mediator complex, subunit Med8 [Neohortaea acidophila]
MAMTQDNIRALDQLRQRLSQLSTSISSLRADLERNEPLPTWPSLQTSAHALSFNLEELSKTFNNHRQFLNEAHAYPLPQFPGNTHEALLGQLLRKKLEPGAEDWVAEHTTKFDQRNGARAGDKALDKNELKELWAWAAPTSAGIVRPMLEDGGAFDDDYTIAEREAGVASVVTGLKRQLDDEEDEDEEEEGDGGDTDKMEDVVSSNPQHLNAGKEEDQGVNVALPAMPLGSMLRLMTTGTRAQGNQSNLR